MDKILKRVRTAERQVARRLAKAKAMSKTENKTQDRRWAKAVGKEIGHHRYKAIKARHEDWSMGPLAPRRDVSRVDEHGNYYGSVSSLMSRLEVPLRETERAEITAWCGGHKLLCLAVGDRVVLTEGPYKGKISTIKRINREFATVELGDEIITNITVPDYIRTDETDAVEPQPTPWPISAVRLVHPLPDHKTGKTRDVIIRELKPVNVSFDRPTRKLSFARMVPGANVRIPWPIQKPAVRVTHACDTQRIDVEKITFVPTLLKPPMPEAVLDELRNRYSVFRTRHTPEYIALKEAEAAEAKNRKKSGSAMLLPVQEFNRKLREERRALGQPLLTDEMLAKIGEVIAKNKQRRAAGINIEAENVTKAVEQMSIQEDASTTTDAGPRV